MQREQAGDVGVAGQQRAQHPGQVDGPLDQVVAHQVGPGRRGVPGGEHAGGRRRARRRSRAGSSAGGGTRYGMRAAAIFFLARVIRAAIVGSLTRNARATSAVVQAAQQAQGQRDLRLRRQRRVAAGEDQPQPVVRDTGHRRAVAGPARLGTRGVVLDEQRQLPRAASPRAAGRRAPGRRATVVSQAAGPVRHTRARPGRERLGVRVLDALLGEVEVAGDAHRRGEHEAPLARCAAHRVGDRGR